MEDFVRAYTNKILGVRNYASDKKEFNVCDFIDLEILAKFLDEVDTSESDISPAGKSFIKKYYGFSNLARLLVGQKLLNEAIADYSIDELTHWLENLEPMQAITFIEKSRGNIFDNQLLKEEWLPPLEV